LRLCLRPGSIAPRGLWSRPGTRFESFCRVLQRRGAAHQQDSKTPACIRGRCQDHTGWITAAPERDARCLEQIKVLRGASARCARATTACLQFRLKRLADC
jgi:hypothetical protein